MNNRGEKKKWYAVYTRSRSEKVVARELTKSGIEHYLPIYKSLKQWSDRKKFVEEPLIRSYLFVYISMEQYYEVLNTIGVVTIVKFSGKPVSIPEWQIKNLKILLSSGSVFEHVTNEFNTGDMVKITSGSLKGLTGTVLTIKDKQKLMIGIDSLEHNYIVDISTYFIEPVVGTVY